MADVGTIRWIGGGSGAGKSTVARLLGDRHGVPVVHSDLSLRAHADAMRGSARIDAFVDATMDERWVDRDPGEMARTFPWFVGDGFDLLLAGLPPERPLIVEGFRVLPSLVAPLLGAGGRAVWLIPTPGMRARVFAGRALHGRAFWERTSDPSRALANLLERDRLFTDRLRAECEGLGLPVIDVDGSESVPVLAGRVEAVLGLR